MKSELLSSKSIQAIKPFPRETEFIVLSICVVFCWDRPELSSDSQRGPWPPWRGSPAPGADSRGQSPVPRRRLAEMAF